MILGKILTSVLFTFTMYPLIKGSMVCIIMKFLKHFPPPPILDVQYKVDRLCFQEFVIQKNQSNTCKLREGRQL